MKNNLIFLIISTCFITSCDKETFYNYYIQNNCEKEISISIKDKHDKESVIYIKQNSTEKIYTAKGIGKVFDEYVELYFKTIFITKDNITCNKNYANKTLWSFEKLSKHNANCYLTINPEDFER